MWWSMKATTKAAVCWCQKKLHRSETAIPALAGCSALPMATALLNPHFPLFFLFSLSIFFFKERSCLGKGTRPEAISNLLLHRLTNPEGWIILQLTKNIVVVANAKIKTEFMLQGIIRPSAKICICFLLRTQPPVMCLLGGVDFFSYLLNLSHCWLFHPLLGFYFKPFYPQS